jgi:predicted nucleic acid-binding protein
MPIADLRTLPDGSEIFIDSNVFVYALSGRSPQCRSLLQKVSIGEIIGVTSYHVLGEVTHKLMLAEHLASGGSPAGARKYLEAHPEVVRALTHYWTAIERILAMNILFVPVDEATIRTAQAIRMQSGLLNNDSLIAATMMRLGLTNIASNDQDFASVAGFSIFKPTDA